MYHESNKRGAKWINCNNLPGLSNLQQASASSFPQSNQIKQKPTTAFEAKKTQKTQTQVCKYITSSGE